MLKVIEQAKKFMDHDAILSNGKTYTYQALLLKSGHIATKILNNERDLSEARVAFMVHPGFNYVATMWGIWQSGGVAVPLCLTHPLPSLQYVLEDISAKTIIVSKDFVELLSPFVASSKITLIIIDDVVSELMVQLPSIEPTRIAMILYTSGTTNKPKGVVTTHTNIEAQISTLVKEWKWTSQDKTICVLPLHHVHGIINIVGCSLWSGASCMFTNQFSPAEIFDLFNRQVLNVFMAVPTIYFKLITFFDGLNDTEKANLKNNMAYFRLMVCGSAALPISVMERWEKISGHVLLERYGMTELGMAISNPYEGLRRAGYVGMPLPGVNIRLVNEQYEDVLKDELGEIVVKGANVFKEYWGNKEATIETFTSDGWFKTGDIAMIDQGYYKIMGRNSVDIIKSGGYKISALEIEEILREHELIDDCAVVGIEDDEWGELIVAAVVLNKLTSQPPNIEEISNWFIQKSAHYKKPRKYLFLNELPRNTMGKVVKNEVKKLFKQ